MAKNRIKIPSMTIQGENVVGMISANGSARVNVNQKVIHQSSPEMEKLFKRIHKEMKARPEDPKVSKAKLENQVKKIEAEAAKGAAADQTKLERWIKALAKMAPDIVDVMAASLAGPVAGFTVVFKKIVERARATSGET
jgi:Ternary complex associated domain 2